MVLIQRKLTLVLASGAVEERAWLAELVRHTHSGPPHIRSSECLHPASLPMLSITRDTRSWLAGAENCILQPKYVSFS